MVRGYVQATNEWPSTSQRNKLINPAPLRGPLASLGARYGQAVRRREQILPEVEAWWDTQAPSQHITCWPVRYPGSKVPGGSRGSSPGRSLDNS